MKAISLLLLCLCGCGEHPVNEWANTTPITVVPSHTNAWATSNVRVQVDGGYMSNGLITITNWGREVPLGYTSNGFSSGPFFNTNRSLYERIAWQKEDEATNCVMTGFEMGAMWAAARARGDFSSSAIAKSNGLFQVTNWLATRPGRWP